MWFAILPPRSFCILQHNQNLRSFIQGGGVFSCIAHPIAGQWTEHIEMDSKIVSPCLLCQHFLCRLKYEEFKGQKVLEAIVEFQSFRLSSMTFPMHDIWEILSNTSGIWPIQMGLMLLSMAFPWIQTLHLGDLCSVQSKTSASRTWWVHSALNSVLHCETSSLLGVRSTHCTVQAGHEKENSPKSPSAAQVMRGLPHFPHPEVLPVLAYLCLLGQSTSIQKYAQVCNSISM